MVQVGVKVLDKVLPKVLAAAAPVAIIDPSVFDGGTIKLYSLASSSDAGDLLASGTLPSRAFANESGGNRALHGTWSMVATKNGTARGLLISNVGATINTWKTVTTSGNGGDVIIDNDDVEINDIIAIATMVLTEDDPVDPDIEPVRGGSQTLLLDENFDTYTAFSDAVAGGWRAGGADGTVQDTSTDVGGSNLIITGRSGSGKAIRLAYHGIANADGQESHGWKRTNWSDLFAGLPGHTLYMSYYFRINPGGGHTLDQAEVNGDINYRVQVKWWELWTASDRAQFSTQYSPYLAMPGAATLFTFYANGGGVTRTNASQAIAPFAKDGAGSWHRATHQYVAKSSSGAQDGVARMWVDGTLIVSSKLSDKDQKPPGSPSGAVWCEAADLAAFYDGSVATNRITHLEFGGPSTSPLWPFTLDLDDLTVWRD